MLGGLPDILESDGASIAENQKKVKKKFGKEETEGRSASCSRKPAC
jgi:hypothetical protein